MSEERMPYRQYAKFEKVFYLYGSTAKLVQGVRPEEWRSIAEDIWDWANTKVDDLVGACMEGFIEPPPVLDTPPNLADYDDSPVNGTNPNARWITVKEKHVVKTGQKGNQKWALTKIIATDNVAYSTFAGSRYEEGKEYAIEFEEVHRGDNKYLQIKEPK